MSQGSDLLPPNNVLLLSSQWNELIWDTIQQDGDDDNDDDDDDGDDDDDDLNWEQDNPGVSCCPDGKSIGDLITGWHKHNLDKCGQPSNDKCEQVHDLTNGGNWTCT